MLEALKAIIDNRWLTRRVQESINKAERAIEKAEPK